MSFTLTSSGLQEWSRYQVKYRTITNPHQVDGGPAAHRAAHRKAEAVALA